MAKVNKEKNSYDLVVKALKKELLRLKKKDKDLKFLTQEQVFDFMDKKKLLVSDEGSDELFEVLLKKKVVSTDADKADVKIVNEKGIEVELKSFDNTTEISLDDVKETIEVKDSELVNKLTSTDDIVK